MTPNHNRDAANRRKCGVKKHRATSLHYDFRLEFEDVLLSWVVPDGPSYRAGEYRIAIRVGDHDPKYLPSERVIPPGSYGAGPIMLWDIGYWVPLPGYEDIREGMRNGCLRFMLDCCKLKGIWTLRRRTPMEPGEHTQIWDLIKEPDQFARSEDEPDILVEAPDSVSTGRTLEEIEQDDNLGTDDRGAFEQLTLPFPFEPQREYRNPSSSQEMSGDVDGSA